MLYKLVVDEAVSQQKNHDYATKHHGKRFTVKRAREESDQEDIPKRRKNLKKQGSDKKIKAKAKTTVAKTQSPIIPQTPPRRWQN